MKLFASFICIPFVVATNAFGGVVGPSDAPQTLLESIATAVKKNPKTKAVDELLEAINQSTLAMKKHRLPRGHVSCSMNRDYHGGSVNDVRLSNSTATSGSCNVGGSITVYDGGAGHFRAQSAEANRLATEAAYNTADSLIANTRGSLASKTQSIFSLIAQMNSFLDFYRNYLNVLKEFKTFDNDDNITAMISDIEQSLVSFNNTKDLAVANFRYVVTVDPSPQIDGFEAAIQSLTIPESVDEAVEIAQTRGSEYIRRDLNVKMAEFNLRAERASYGPLVTLHGSVGAGRYRIDSDYSVRSSSRNAGVGLTLSIPLDPAKGNRIRSAESSLRAEQLQREGALQDADYQIRSTYKSIANSHKLYISVKNSYDEQWVYVQTLVEKIRTKNTGGLDIDDMLTSLGILSQRHGQLVQVQMSLLQDFFSIQSVTGILFDNIDAQPSVVRQY